MLLLMMAGFSADPTAVVDQAVVLACCLLGLLHYATCGGGSKLADVTPLQSLPAALPHTPGKTLVEEIHFFSCLVC
jgi:hypothetical protein